ncbi:MAG: heavy metal-binding domain-containing protein [Acidimicrobiales bacterium]
MAEWLGSGLPPSALARIRTATESGFRFSPLPAAGHLAVESCGLEPIGPVVGCAAKWLDWGEFGLGEVGCGFVASAKGGPILAPSHVSYAAPAYSAWRSAIDRMVLEASSLGADGVVDVVLTEKRAKAEVREFIVTGTAVRSKAMTHLRSPFTTTLSGSDVAKLMTAGWMPASIVLGLSFAIRHDTFRERRARARLRSSCEVLGVSQLVQAARQDARHQLGSRTREIGADGAVLTSQLTLSIRQRKVSRTHRDIVAEVRATASAIVAVAGVSALHRTESTSVIPLTSVTSSRWQS